MNRISFLTVVYNKDFDQLDQQLCTAEEFLLSPHTFYIILCDELQYIDELQSIVNKYPAHPCKIIHYLDLNGFTAPTTRTNGWSLQQALKLLVATHIETEYYAVLDAKNKFIELFDEDIFFKGEQARYTLDNFTSSTEWFQIMWKNSFALFGLNSADYVDQKILATPPYLMNTNIVCAMLEYFDTNAISITDNVGVILPADPKCADYYLYNAWIIKTKQIDQIVWSDELVASLPFDRTLRRH